MSANLPDKKGVFEKVINFFNLNFFYFTCRLSLSLRLQANNLALHYPHIGMTVLSRSSSIRAVVVCLQQSQGRRCIRN